MQEKGRICLFSLDPVGFQKVCTSIILTDGNGRHQLMVSPDSVTSWVNQTIIAYLTGAEKRQHRMHSGKIGTKMCSLVAPEPHQKIA